MKTSFLFLLVATILIAFLLMNTPSYYRTKENFALDISGKQAGILVGGIAAIGIVIFILMKWVRGGQNMGQYNLPYNGENNNRNNNRNNRY